MNRTLALAARALRSGAALLVLGACADTVAPPAPYVEPELQANRAPTPEREPLTIYTQNGYLGGDTGPIFSLDLTNLPAVLQATNLFWAQVKGSDAPARAAEIVAEIEARRPHLVGLQEVFGFAVVDPRDGTVHDYVDLLAAIRAELHARRLPYEIVRVQENTSSFLPMAVGATGLTRVLRFTDRVVALRRTDVEISEAAQGTYQARIPLGPLDVTRGWIRISGEHDGIPFHFVTTHLETQSAGPVQAGQLAELLRTVLAGLDGLTILAGDLNSDAAAGPGAPSWTPTYGALLDAGFVDAWRQSPQHPRDAGYTCCQETDLRNGPSVLDERIDFVLLRSTDNPASSGRIPGSVAVELVGEEQTDRTASGLWPTDHAGLLVELRLPGGLMGEGR